MSVVPIANIISWSARIDAQEQSKLLEMLEDGQVLFFPGLAFLLQEQEQALRSPTVANGRSKNISYDVQSGCVSGSSLAGLELDVLRAMMSRFAMQAAALVRQLLPSYADVIQPRLTSYRPVEVEGRDTSDRKNDTRLHIDAFASRPNQGRRVLRMFSNVNHSGKPRTWLVGEAFEPYARRFLAQARGQWPLEGALLERFKVTKQRRTQYDHYMLQLHDKGKLDDAYQRATQRSRMDFPPGSTWMCFTDQVLHAALSGQYLLEQTFQLPAAAMRHPERSPLRTLERLTGRSLV